MSLLIIAAAVLGGTNVPDSPRVFEKVRSDGATVVCIRHDKKPSILTSRVECKPAAQWRKTDFLDTDIISAGGTNVTESFFREPKATPRLIGK